MPVRTPSTRPVRVAIVGTGAIARVSHLPALLALGAEQPVEVVAAVDPASVRAFCTDAGIGHAYTSLAPMLAEQVAARQDFGPDVPSSHEAQLRGLLNDPRAGRRPRSSCADGRKSLELVTALYKAAFTGGTVRAGETGRGDPYYGAPHGNAPGWAPQPQRQPQPQRRPESAPATAPAPP